MPEQIASNGRSAVPSAELTQMLAQHERFAMGRGGFRVSFKGLNLAGAILANRRLDEADFTGACLAGANLHGTNLTRASLFCADLTGCNLRNANLMQADIRGASFRGADLSFAVLDFADLRKATMMIVGDAGVLLVDHSKNGLGFVDFSHATLRNASFGKAKLEGAIFNGALLLGTQFRGAELTNASFTGAVLMGVTMAELNLPPEAFVDCVFDVTEAARAKSGLLKDKLVQHQQWVLSDGREGAPAVLDGEDLRPLGNALAGRNLVGLTARGVIAIGLDFSRSQLQGAKFDGADLRGADFSGCDLSGVSFHAAKLVHARFERARLGNLKLRNGEVLSPNFLGADAQADQFRDAVLDDSPAALGIGGDATVEL
jgi:uncharacterized protein YjbI with pentapeptide repeats